MATGQVGSTAQNNCFWVDYDSVKDKCVEITHINLNDDTVEEFMNVLHFVRDNCPEEMLTYTDPL